MEKTVFYSDQWVITENKNGFVFNFLKDKSEIEEAIDYGFRIGMSPFSTKELLYTLFAAMGEYEAKHGEVEIDPRIIKKIIADKPAPIGF